LVPQENSKDVKLAITPDNYWQTDALDRDVAAAIMSDNRQLKGRSILG
jgi:hypothetical protein